jgi:ferrochelatase
MSGATIGVLVMAYGGPAALEEVPGYLADIRSGRVTPRRVVEEITEHYRRIGGASPILDISRRQAGALQAALGPGFSCRVGMRHWAPWIEDAVGEMAEEGIRKAVGVVLAPHYSRLNTERYFSKVEDGLRLYRAPVEFSYVKSYHTSSSLIEALARRVQEGLERWPARERDRVHVVFSAHSLPARILRDGDPYDAQLRETAALVAGRAGLPEERWSWSYQSAGKSPEPWLGPQLEDHIPALARRGIRDIVSVPVGFVADHVEILYDIDIEARAAAEKAGARLERPPALNDDPLFIQALADAVKAAL